jgi:hypothetical protein
MDDFELRRRLRGLAGEREPSRELWPGIAAAIAASPARSRQARSRRPRPPRWLGWAAAAAVTCLAVLLWPQQAADPLLSAEHRPDSEQARHQAHMQQELAAMHWEYRLALAQLAETPMPPALRPAARELKESERALRDALREQPQATYLLAQLRRTYEQQLRLGQLAQG